MASSVHKAVFTFRDSQGRVARETYLAQADDTSATNNIGAWTAAMLPLLQAMSNAHVQSPTFGPVYPIYGTSAVYVSAQDKAVMLFYTAQGDRHQFQIPAPKTAIFQPDGITVNPLNAAVAAYLAYVYVSVVNGANVLVNDFIAGFRTRKRLPRRGTSLILAPLGTTPEE